MPVQRGRNFYRWGNHGKKYYYKANNPASREKAKALAAKQGRAIQASKHRRL
jgi:hypothetical protein